MNCMVLLLFMDDKEYQEMTMGKKNLSLSLERAWNELPQAVRETKSTNAFKNAYDRW